MSKIDTSVLSKLLKDHAAATAEVERLHGLETKLQADAAALRASGSCESENDVTLLAAVQARLALLPADAARAEARLTALDGQLKTEARAVAKSFEAQRQAEHKALSESAVVALKPFFGNEYMPPALLETLPAVKAASSRAFLAGHWSVNGGNSSGIELAAAVIAGVND